jgi:hypothetical protein
MDFVKTLERCTRLSQSPPCIRKQQLERLIGMRIVKTARLGQVGPLTPDGETADQIVERRHGMTEGGDCAASRIFVKRDIAAIGQAILNPPMLAIQIE